MKWVKKLSKIHPLVETAARDYDQRILKEVVPSN